MFFQVIAPASAREWIRITTGRPGSPGYCRIKNPAHTAVIRLRQRQLERIRARQDSRIRRVISDIVPLQNEVNPVGLEPRSTNGRNYRLE